MMKRAKCLMLAWAVMPGLALIAVPVGCSDQYADVGTVDVSAAKAAAEKNGVDKFQTHGGRASPSTQGKGTSKPGRPR